MLYVQNKTHDSYPYPTSGSTTSNWLLLSYFPPRLMPNSTLPTSPKPGKTCGPLPPSHPLFPIPVDSASNTCLFPHSWFRLGFFHSYLDEGITLWFSPNLEQMSLPVAVELALLLTYHRSWICNKAIFSLVKGL